MRIILVWLLFILLLAPAYAQMQSALRRPVVFVGATIIDVKGGTPTPDMTIIVIGNRIAAIGKAGKVRLPPNAQVINASGKYLIPGLWDMHAHLSPEGAPAEIDMPLMVANGVTGIP
jgi:imidazolonepropionase-like amidohydrolase